MKILILSNWSEAIAELNALTSPNKQDYCDLHGYFFENINIAYDKQVEFLDIIMDRISKFDIVMTIGCDAIFTNTSIKIEDKTGLIFQNPTEPFPADNRVIIAKEHLSFWSINNDVMIWPHGIFSSSLVSRLIEDHEIWMKYPWKWQHHLWNIIQSKASTEANVRIVPAKEINSTFQPFIVDQNGNCFRTIGPSSWQLGDWILHALDMSPEMRIQVIKWGLKFVGNGSWIP